MEPREKTDIRSRLEILRLDDDPTEKLGIKTQALRALINLHRNPAGLSPEVLQAKSRIEVLRLKQAADRHNLTLEQLLEASDISESGRNELLRYFEAS